jgi:hypothetical protein
MANTARRAAALQYGAAHAAGCRGASAPEGGAVGGSAGESPTEALQGGDGSDLSAGELAQRIQRLAEAAGLGVQCSLA